MAYFRCGGGGVPASVKTDMNAVLNKKFGTSTDYPPADWAPTVNLMGPLPEKTQASASVCSFSDGADDVPTKSLVVTIPPTLDGVSLVSERQTGRNLVALNVSPQQAKRDYGITVNTQTADTLNITTTGIAYACERLFYTLAKGTYTVKYIASSSDNYNPMVSIYRTSGTGIAFSIPSNTARTFTITETTDIDIRLFASGSGDTTIRTVEYTNLQIELGSTAHAYEPYQTPTTYTASLGRAVYGGQVDIVKGEGTDNGKKIKLNTLSWSYDDTSYSYGIFLMPNNIADMTGNLQFVCTNYVNNGHPRTQLLDGEIGVFNLASSNKRLVIRDDNCTTLEQFLTKIVDYDLVYESTTDTPFTFDGQEIPTRLGYNAFWSDSGDTEVTYRADIDLLLGGN